MKDFGKWSAFMAAACFWAGTAWGADPLTLTITATNYNGYAIPNDFSGLSYEAYDVGYGDHWVNGNIFSPSDSQMLTLFENMGIHHLRIGGGTSDGSGATLLTHSDIDNLFEFAQAAGVNVIFSMQLLDGNPEYDATNDAEYIWTNTYKGQLEYFAFGNEPDGGESSDWGSFNNYINAWNGFYYTNQLVVPGAPVAGPDTCCQDGWNTSFADDEDGTVALFTTHDYFGGTGSDLTAAEDVQNMLSITFMTNSYWTELNNLSTVVADKFPLRFTETDDCTGGIPNASDSFASALWALDALQWWAALGTKANCVGLDFHNNEWLETDTIFQDAHYGNLNVHPKAYAFKAWDLGGHGYEVPLNLSNPNNANDTCYAVGGGQDLYVTIINRHTTYQGSIAACTIEPNGFQSASVSAIYLACSTTNLESTNGVTLGGSGGVITNNAQWQGIWTDLTPDTNGSCVVNVSPSEAAVVHLHAGCAYEGPVQINQNGTVEMFANHSGEIYHDWQKVSGIMGGATNNWVGWNDIGSIGGGVTAVGGPTVIKNLDGTLEVFISGSDGNVYNNYQLKPSGGWNGWNQMPGSSGITDLKAVLNSDGSLNLFGLNSGNVEYTSETAPGVPSGTWNNLGAPSSTTIQAGFQVGQNLSGILEVCAVDASGNVWHIWQNSQWKAWGNWNSLAGATVNPRIQVGRNSYGSLYLFGMDTTSSNIDYINQLSPGGSWGRWYTTNLIGEAVRPGFVAGQDGNGRFEISAVGINGTVYHDWQTTTIVNGQFNWSGWNTVGGGGAGTDPQLVTCNLLNGCLQTFGINTANDDVWSTWQLTPAGSWNNWSDFGGNGMIFYSGQP